MTTPEDNPTPDPVPVVEQPPPAPVIPARPVAGESVAGQPTHGDGTIWMVAAIGVPLIGVWLLMGAIIIWRAANDQDVLENIEGLLTALAVLTIPATQFIQGVLRKWNNGD